MKKYGLKNYKLIENYEFDLNKINIILGENSSGKSSLLRSLQLLRQSLYFSYQNLNENFKSGIDFGEYFNLLTAGKKIDEKIYFQVEFDSKLKAYGDMQIIGVEWAFKKNILSNLKIELIEGIIEVEFNNKTVKEVKINGKVIEIFKGIKLFYNIFDAFPTIGDQYQKIENKFLSRVIIPNITSIGSNDKTWIEHINLLDDIYLNLDLKFYLKKTNNTKDENEMIKWLNKLNELDVVRNKEVIHVLNVIIEKLNLKFVDIFTEIVYTGPIRSLGERYYRVGQDSIYDQEINNDVSKKLYTLSIATTGLTLKMFNEWIKKYFDFGINVEIIKTKNNENIFYSIEIEKDGEKRNIVDMGAGYSQILPILFVCFERKEKNNILLIEQPELHLHPKMQSDFIDLLLKLSLSNKNLKFIIETHSNLMIDRIGKNIYKKNYSEKDINIYLFNKDKNLEIKKTNYSEKGLLKEWPVRFFSAKELNKWS